MQFKSVMMILWAAMLAQALNGFTAPATTDANKKLRIEAMIAQFESKFNVLQIDAISAIKMMSDEFALFLDAREDKEIAVSKISGAISKREF